MEYAVSLLESRQSRPWSRSKSHPRSNLVLWCVNVVTFHGMMELNRFREAQESVQEGEHKLDWALSSNGTQQPTSSLFFCSLFLVSSRPWWKGIDHFFYWENGLRLGPPRAHSEERKAGS